MGAGRVGMDFEMSRPAGFFLEIPDARPMLATGLDDEEGSPEEDEVELDDPTGLLLLVVRSLGRDEDEEDL